MISDWGAAPTCIACLEQHGIADASRVCRGIKRVSDGLCIYCNEYLTEGQKDRLICKREECGRNRRREYDARKRERYPERERERLRLKNERRRARGANA